MDSGLSVPVFNQADDLIACLNKAMTFLKPVASSRFPSTSNQLRTSSNPRNHATIQDDKVKVTWLGNAPNQIGLGTMHGIRKKAMLADAHESSQILDEEQLAFLVDLSILDGQAAQTTIPNTIAFQTKDINAYDSDCDDVSNAKVVLMANLSNYGSNVISKVPHFEPNHTHMDNQSVHAIQDFKQTPAIDFIDDEITSDSNIIAYS
nr:hypothetical protein [Tanacetum cinerariifolium]